MEQIIHNKHLLQRAGFGFSIYEISKLKTIKTKDLVLEIFNNCQKYEVLKFDVVDNSLKELYNKKKSETLNTLNAKPQLSNDERKVLRMQSREDLKKLNLKWFDEMVNSSSALNEKMALFWLNHFSCREVNIFFQQNLLHILRANAVGKFGDLLKLVSKSASMISFLNNQQNKKEHPNENFAREVLELFTLGRNNYNEDDIKEAARAFTGWSFNFDGEFVFRRMQHDDKEKTFLGKTGFFDGDDILDIILKQPQTAKFITTKIYKFFVNEVPNEKNISWLSKRFFDSNYDIKLLLLDIFSSKWFYDKENLNANIKSPIDLLVGLIKFLSIKLKRPELILLLQKSLGQLLFYPPNVAGWPGGKNWIDTSSLMIRLQIPKLIKDDSNFVISNKVDDDLQMGMQDVVSMKKEDVGSKKFSLNATINWNDYIKQFEDIKKENLLSFLSILILSKSNIDTSIINNEIDFSSRENFIKTATIALMCTPEFQLC